MDWFGGGLLWLVCLAEPTCGTSWQSLFCPTAKADSVMGPWCLRHKTLMHTSGNGRSSVGVWGGCGNDLGSLGFCVVVKLVGWFYEVEELFFVC